MIIPTFNRPRELGLCLDGFVEQTVPREQFEVIVIDDGSSEDLAPVCEPFRNRLRLKLLHQENRGPSVARNAGIARARSQLLLLYDDDLRPFSDVVERSLEFHRRFPDEGAASLLHFVPDPELAVEPLTRWAFPRLYPFPAKTGVQNWSRFWSGATTCKRSLFEQARFSPEYRSLEDAEFALRVSCGIDLRVWFEPRPAGVMTRRLTLPQILAREYSSGYFYYKMMMDYPGELGLVNGEYSPEPGIIHDRIRLAALLASARALAKETVTPQRFEMLCSLWNRAAVHARAEGWLDAQDKKPARPPGTVGPFLKE